MLEPHEHTRRTTCQALKPKVGIETLRMLVSRVDDKRPRRNDARRRGSTANGVLQ